MHNMYEKALDDLSLLPESKLSILRLAEPINAAVSSAQKRSSDASTDANDNPSPASLNEDLAHYKELFAKLRFSYVEQVTKEKFLRAIVGEPPQIVEHQENVALESRLTEQKAALKAQKLAVAAMVEALEAKGRMISQRHESIETQTHQLAQMPSQNDILRAEIASLQLQLSPNNGDPNLNLPLQATQDLFDVRKTELEAVERRLRNLQQLLPRKTREAELLDNELRPLELQRAGTVAAAEEAKARRELGEGGHGDSLELKGRWYRNVQETLRDILDT